MKPKARKSSTRTKKTLSRRCYYCEKRFKNPQAVRGHQRHCPVRRQKAQAQGTTEAQPVRDSTGPEDNTNRRSGRSSQHSKALLLDTHEAVERLVLILEHIVVSAQLFFQTAFSQMKGNISPEQWAKLHQDLIDVERDLDQLVACLRLDQTQLFSMYHRLAAIREAWLQYREHDYLQYEQKRLPMRVNEPIANDPSLAESRKMIDEDNAALDDVLTKIKLLLVAAH